MKLCERNTKTIYYALYQKKVPVLDDDGFETGDYTVGYATPVDLDANVVSKHSTVAREYFGEQFEYHKVILVDKDVPIKEDTAIWIDTDNPITDNTVKHNYQVAGSADSLHYNAIAVKKVTNNEV
ncbi:MAG: hypothetical protein IKB64_07445 [Paludibacteraceae bacterium]|nr:hypothetical protein [Paludibacteraceae bacterium]